MPVPLFLLATAVLIARSSQADPAARVLEIVARSEQKCRRLAARLAACRTAGQDIAYPDASLAVAELFCRFSRYDAGQADLRAAALQSMTYVDRMLDGEL